MKIHEALNELHQFCIEHGVSKSEIVVIGDLGCVLNGFIPSDIKNIEVLAHKVLFEQLGSLEVPVATLPPKGSVTTYAFMKQFGNVKVIHIPEGPWADLTDFRQQRGYLCKPILWLHDFYDAVNNVVYDDFTPALRVRTPAKALAMRKQTPEYLALPEDQREAWLERRELVRRPPQ